MRIKKVEIRNFRAISSSSIDASPVTSIIGENNCGKSSFLAAMQLFFSSSPKIEIDDFHLRNFKEPIEVTIHFSDLTPYEEKEFGSKVNDGVLIVTRRISASKEREYLVSGKANSAFNSIRSTEKKSDITKEYNSIRESFDLPKISKAEEAEEALSKWESENPDKCVFQKISGFFGAENVAVGKLNYKTNFIFVPAIKQIREELDAKSPVRELLSGIAKQAIENNLEYQEFLSNAKIRIAELTSPESVSSLSEISGDLTDIIKRYYNEAELEATWEEVSSFPIDLPKPDVLVRDGLHQTKVDYVGHGMQRAIILTLLEYISAMNQKQSGDFERAQSDIIIAIEEPELFQHPTKQRLFYRALSDLAENFNKKTGIRLQVIYATHSPLLISLPEVERIRLVRKSYSEGAIDITVRSTTLQECADFVAPLRGFTANPHRYGVGLHIVTSDIAEAFFSKTVVLVEGISDVAILEAAFKIRNRDVLSDGIVIKSVGGKRNLDRPLLVFQKFGIPTMVIMDNDYQLFGTQKEADEIKWNKFIQQICGIDVISDWPDTVGANFASWKGTIEDYIKNASGENIYNSTLSEMSENYSISGSDCAKSPVVASSLLTRLRAQGVGFEKLDSIIDAIDALNV